MYLHRHLLLLFEVAVFLLKVSVFLFEFGIFGLDADILIGLLYGLSSLEDLRYLIKGVGSD